MDVATLKILAAILSLVGSGLLAWRVKGILEALALAALAHEANIQQLMNPGRNIINLGNSTAHVEKAQKYGLLVFGFLCLFASAALQLLALFVGPNA